MRVYASCVQEGSCISFCDSDFMFQRRNVAACTVDQGRDVGAGVSMALITEPCFCHSYILQTCYTENLLSNPSFCFDFDCVFLRLD